MASPPGHCLWMLKNITQKGGVPLKLSDEDVLAALVAYGSPTAAAKALGCSTQPIYSRLKDQTFKAEFDRRRNHNMSAACSALQAALLDAVESARAILNDAENAPQIRLNAANMLLSNALRYTEQHDILQRIEALETAQRGDWN